MKALFIGCHCDDIELGCAATIHKHPDWQIRCVVLTKDSSNFHWKTNRSYEHLDLTCKQSLEMLGVTDVKIYTDITCCFFQRSRQVIWERLHREETEFQPDIIFSQYADSNQDHATLYEETQRNFRDKPVYFYRPHERDLHPFTKNAFSIVDESDAEAKLKCLEAYKVYDDRIYFDPEVIKAGLVLNGSLTGHKYAESFFVDKHIF